MILAGQSTVGGTPGPHPLEILVLWTQTLELLMR